MSLRIRRGTETQRTGVTFDTGELVYTTDTKQLWVGDGVTAGGSPIVGSNITGYGLTFNASSKRIEVTGLTADDITNGVNNKFFSVDAAQDAAALLFSTGSHTNISFQYDDTLGKINATVVLDGIGITDIVADTSPQLGGNLDLNAKDITGTGNINITGGLTLTGDVDVNNITASTVGADTFTVGLKLNSNSISTLAGAFNGFELITTAGLEVALTTHRGTNQTPLATQAGDIIGAFTIKGFDGINYNVAGAINAQFHGAATVTDVYPKSVVSIIAGAGGENVVLATLSGATGVFSVPVLQVEDADGTLPALPVAGMIVLDAGTFKGYTGTAWVNLN